MNHDDGNSLKDINKSDIVLLGVNKTTNTNLNLLSEQGANSKYSTVK